MTDHIDFVVESFDHRNGRLHLINGCMEVIPASWNWQQVETIRQLIADNVECLVRLRITPEGTLLIEDIEAGEFLPRLSAPGGSA